MNILEWTAVICAGSFTAGFLGALTGLGGGVVIIPMLTLLFGVDIRYAIGASLVSVIATSSGAAVAYIREGYSNIRIGMLLEVATTIGAVAGAWLAHMISTGSIAVIFGAVLIYSAFASLRPPREQTSGVKEDTLAARLRLNGSYPSGGREVPYTVSHVPGGFGMMFVAGTLSGLLGIGSGAAKVLAMDRIMKIPFKVSTTTSNFMIGVTAAASAGIYLSRGYIDPGIAMPVMLGVLLGSLAGARVLMRARTKWLRRIFSVVIFILAVEMIYNGLKGSI
ncbi:MAG: sulfite exporter TauE/SafE family protein [Acidobacteriota bacterium]